MIVERAVDVLLDKTLKQCGGSLANMVTMTVFIVDVRYGDRLTEIRKEIFKECFPGSALITVTGLARPGLLIEIARQHDARGFRAELELLDIVPKDGKTPYMPRKIIEAVSGEAMPLYFQRHFLAPLGCAGTDVLGVGEKGDIEVTVTVDVDRRPDRCDASMISTQRAAVSLLGEIRLRTPSSSTSAAVPGVEPSPQSRR